MTLRLVSVPERGPGCLSNTGWQFQRASSLSGNYYIPRHNKNLSGFCYVFNRETVKRTQTVKHEALPSEITYQQGYYIHNLFTASDSWTNCRGPLARAEASQLNGWPLK
jgi:hypothetical protein